jgi:DNA-binding transcriptional LysR family regulator
MRLEQLQAFLAIAETGSFQQAAQQCNVTQSTISRQIQTLETMLGLPLFHRTSRAKLTIAGERFMPHARKICQEWQSATHKIEELRDGKQSELCIAAMHSICVHYLPPVLQRFCRLYPAVQLRVTALGSDRALKVLKDGLVDAAIVMNNRLLTATPDMFVDVLFEEPIHALMAATHPLAQQPQMSWGNLMSYPQVVFKDGYGMQRLVQEEFERRGVPLRAALELNTPDAFRGVIRGSEMMALLPNSALIEAYHDPTVVVRPLAADSESRKASPDLMDFTLTRQVVLVTTRDRLQVPLIEAFCQLVQDYIPKQITVSQPIEPKDVSWDSYYIGSSP